MNKTIIILSFFCISSFYLRGQSSSEKISIRTEFFSSTKAEFVAPKVSIPLNKHNLTIGVLLGRHHTFNNFGLGIQLGDVIYPNDQMNTWNLFFITNIQTSIFRKFPSSLINEIILSEFTGGYGVDYKINNEISIYTFFSIGFLIEWRKFDQSIENSTSFDTGGILSLGLKYEIKN